MPSTDVVLSTTVTVVITGTLPTGTYYISCSLGFSVAFISDLTLSDISVGAIRRTLSGTTAMSRLIIFKKIQPYN